jgi:hypothetical protein
MTTPVDAVLFQNISATTAAFELKGGEYMIAGAATWNAGNIELQALGPDDTTLLSFPTALKLTANGMITGYLPPGQYRFAVVSATAVYCSAAGIPIS